MDVMAITMTIEKITPEIAAEYLKVNVKNYRKLQRSVMKRYAEDMKAGRWQMNGEPIVFDNNGMLKNGQHRLAAVILSGVTVEMTVIRGIDESVTAYDLNSVRTATQISNAQGVDVSKCILAGINLLFQLTDDCVRTPMRVVEYAQKHNDELNRAWRCMLNGANSKNVKRGSLMLASYMMLKLGIMPFYEVQVFWKAFSSNDAFGTDGYEVSPALVARKMFDERWKNGSCLRTQREQLDVVIQAMLDLHDGKKRTNSYKISSPFSYESYVKQIMQES